jgi:hypothetical protein
MSLQPDPRETSLQQLSELTEGFAKLSHFALDDGVLQQFSRHAMRIRWFQDREGSLVALDELMFKCLAI